MNNIKTTALILLSCLLGACSNKMTNETIGLYVDYKGLTPDQIHVYVNQLPKTNKRINFGDELTIEVLGIDDFKNMENGNVLPGGEFAVSDEFGNVVYGSTNLFEKYGDVGVKPEDARQLKFNLTAGKPMEKGKTYFYLFRLWDKNTEKELKGNLELEVQM